MKTASWQVMRRIHLKGVFPPIVTPFKGSKYEICYKSAEENFSKWKNEKVNGYVTLGSAGEYVSLKEKEAVEYVKFAAKQAHAQNVPLIAGSGCESTEATHRRCDQFAEVGADAFLVITPHYFLPFLDDAAYIDHYLTVADKSPKPILIYNVPFYSHINLSADCVIELSKHPNIIGIKDIFEKERTKKIAEKTKASNFSILSAYGNSFLPALMCGAVGSISAVASALPRQMKTLLEKFESGELGDAEKIQISLEKPNEMVTKKYGPSGLKYAMSLLGYKPGMVRPPLRNIEPKSTAAKEIESHFQHFL